MLSSASKEHIQAAVKETEITTFCGIKSTHTDYLGSYPSTQCPSDPQFPCAEHRTCLLFHTVFMNKTPALAPAWLKPSQHHLQRCLHTHPAPRNQRCGTRPFIAGRFSLFCSNSQKPSFLGNRTLFLGFEQRWGKRNQSG